jgi:Flp pilus assembly protein TadD
VVGAGPLPLAGPGDDERLRRAEKLIERGRYEEAEALLDAVEAERPTDPVLWMLWSHLRLEQSRDGEALTAIDRSLKLDPRRFRAHVIRGSVLQLSGRERDAARAYRTALDLEPKHPMSPEIRGIVDRLDD